MPRKTQEIEIDGTAYEIRQLGAETGDAVLFRLGRGLAMSDLKPEDFEYVRNIFRKNTKLQIVDTKGDSRKTWVPLESAYDDHFAGRYAAVGEWLKVCFTFNFGDFFDAVKSIVGTQAAVMNSLFPTAARGDSGESSVQTPSE